MKNLFLLSILIFAFANIQAQDQVHDPEARIILDKLSSKLSSKNTARIYFEYTIYNAQNSSDTSYFGYLFIKDEFKYKVIIPNNEIFSDGKKVFSYNKSVNEMNITFADPTSDAIYTPQNLVDVYKEGYKYSYRGEVSFDAKTKVNGKITTTNKTCHIVDLYPEDIDNSPYSIIRIWIDKTTNELVSIKYQQNDGIEQVVDILLFELDVVINDEIFKFNPDLYPANIDVIDFTEE